MTAELAASTPLIPASWGEVVDKITILEIKNERIADAVARANVRRELAALEAVLLEQLAPSDDLSRLRAELRAINLRLWDIEDDIRECEKRQDFGEAFVALARSVYQCNDSRAALKREINLGTGSGLIEEKSYK